MRLVDRNPAFLNSEHRTGAGVEFDCPCDTGHRAFVPFSNPLSGPSTDGWHRTGETFDTLTLTPSIFFARDCGWHGFITDGNVVTV